MHRSRTFRPFGWDLLEDRSVPSGVTYPLPPANVPLERLDNYALRRHAWDVVIAETRSTPVVMLGDSITDYWANPLTHYVGSASWYSQLNPLGAYNFGEAGDDTQNLLWRVENGELAGHPQVAVIQVGTDNLSEGYSVGQTFVGISTIVSAIQTLSPETKVLIMGVFPRGSVPASPLSIEINQLNGWLPLLANGNTVQVLNIGSEFLLPGGAVNAQLLPDALHPSAEGYAVWAGPLHATLERMLGGSPIPPAAPHLAHHVFRRG